MKFQKRLFLVKTGGNLLFDLVKFLMTRFIVRQLLEDRLALNTGAEMIDALQISRHWRVKKKMKKKIFERISQMVSYGAILDNTIIAKMTGKGKIS